MSQFNVNNEIEKANKYQKNGYRMDITKLIVLESKSI